MGQSCFWLEELQGKIEAETKYYFFLNLHENSQMIAYGNIGFGQLATKENSKTRLNPREM